jgi:signal transduction histidine kinase
LTNTRKHANATEVFVELVDEQGELLLRITDNGCGFKDNGSSSGFGLKGIHERVQSLQGTVDIDSAAGQGTKISVRLPSKLRNGGGN